MFDYWKLKQGCIECGECFSFCKWPPCRSNVFQVWNLLADFHGKSVCVMSVVMTSRKVPLYEAVLKKLRELFPQFAPANLMLDYEPSIRKAVSLVYPETRMLGCRYVIVSQK